MDQLKADFAGDLLVVSRHFPLTNVHDNAFAAARASEAAARQGMFDEMADLLFVNQGDWEFVANPQPFFEAYATQIGLSLNQFRADMSDPDIDARINRDADVAADLGLPGTPAFFLNGEQIANPGSLAAFTPLIQAAVDAADDAFVVNRRTGDIEVLNSAAVDFDINPSFSLDVHVAGLSGFAATVDVTVNVTPQVGATVGSSSSPPINVAQATSPAAALQQLNPAPFLSPSGGPVPTSLWVHSTPILSNSTTAPTTLWVNPTPSATPLVAPVTPATLATPAPAVSQAPPSPTPATVKVPAANVSPSHRPAPAAPLASGSAASSSAPAAANLQPATVAQSAVRNEAAPTSQILLDLATIQTLQPAFAATGPRADIGLAGAALPSSQSFEPFHSVVYSGGTADDLNVRQIGGTLMPTDEESAIDDGLQADDDSASSGSDPIRLGLLPAHDTERDPQTDARQDREGDQEEAGAADAAFEMPLNAAAVDQALAEEDAEADF